ncbi:zinc finger C3HC4-type RING finger family protein [Striga asiatica]|uniref:Zinc finger C3HC4-type RING finger family protein n=1 Tax=Striga asiatica TaxID=4170 RepID=A0A5A7P8X4_STRAF|nr:zinc finger C3HC4-type RING finger family protein [Striga asiatica]
MKTIGGPKQAMNRSLKSQIMRPSKKIKKQIKCGVQVPQIKFSDDESLPVVAISRQISNPILPNLILRAIPEQDAVPASNSKPNFAVLIELKAPPLPHQETRSPIDLVMVLDVSSSMFGPKLDLVKRAAGFVVDNLGPSDRLSLVSFSSSAHRVLPLLRMTNAGRAKAKRAVNSLKAHGGTNIPDGLKTGLRVLEERSHRNPVASIMFLSDGQNTCFPFMGQPFMGQPIMGQPIMGQSEVSGLESSRGSINVGDLYADEEKDFLIDISVPVCSENENDGRRRRTPLLDVTCSYKDVGSNERVEMESAEIRRPSFLLACDVKVKIEVDRQRNRLNAAEGLAEAQLAAEKGNLEGARAILSSVRLNVSGSAAGQAGDRLAVQLADEMRETEEKMGCKRKYEEAGRAYALSSMSAHANQRASTRLRANYAYVTPNMANMVSKCHQVIKMEGVKKKEN